MVHLRKLDDLWSLANLAEALRLSGTVEGDLLVVERLADLATTHLRPALTCLRLMAERAPEIWRIYSWEAQLRKVLASALASDDVKLRTDAIEFVNVLAAKGCIEFMDLLAEPE